MQGRAERVIRGSLLGTASVVLAAAAHALAGGGVPGWLGLSASLVGASLVGALVIGRRPSLPRTAVVVTLGQAGFHYLFAGLGGPGVALGAAHDHGAPTFAATTPSGQHAEHLVHLTDPGMLTAHLVAALATLLLLRRAEAAVWGMLRRVIARIVAVAAVVVLTPHRSAGGPGSAPRRAPRRTAVSPPLLRGPPALLSA